MVKVTYTPTPRYENSLAQKLGLGPDDIKREGKLARLLQDLAGKVFTRVEGKATWHFQQAESDGVLALPEDWQHWPLMTPRSVWGTTQKHTWLVSEITVPAAAEGKVFTLHFDLNWRSMQGSTDPQCLVYVNGKIQQSLDGNHNEIVIEKCATPGNTYLIQINAFTFDERPMVGLNMEMRLRNERIESLHILLATAFEVAIRLPQIDGRRHKILDVVEDCLYTLDRRWGQDAALITSLEQAEKVAQKLHAFGDNEDQPTISAFGHTHLDVAWLWRIRHVRQKTARSLANVLNLMDEFPSFVFMYNQAVLFDFLKNDYPELWQRLKKKVQQGQFEIEGAMWVEPDVNISSGESLVRQIMLGMQFHQKEFGVTPLSVWLPDTFGYSAALPQLLVKSGIQFFVTSKLSWNDTDRQPYDTFFWRGIDGSSIKSQLITTQSMEIEDQRTNYNSPFPVTDILGTWKRYEPKAINDEVMMCYGHGDGGGGPTRDMVQRGMVMERGIPGAPKVRMEGLRPFLERLGRKMDTRAADFPVWNGELYLQYHRGTLTSVAKNKKNNRLAERALREFEFVASLAFVAKDQSYPRDELRRLWEIVLINQFHDILPGTSIAEVYEDSDDQYAHLFDAINSNEGAMQACVDALSPKRKGILKLVNTTAQQRDGEKVVFDVKGSIKDFGLQSRSGGSVLQPIQCADGAVRALAIIDDLPSLGWSEAKVSESVKPAGSTLSVSELHLENDLVAVRFDQAGEIISVFDKVEHRELLPSETKANRFLAYEDKPKNYDAWDIDSYFEDRCWQLSESPATIEVVETGPLRAALRIERNYAQSKIVQIISLEDGARQIEFDTWVDWQERQTLLKVAFPFDLNVSETRAEIQFGHVKRATHKNTSWDRARFETSMHRWVDMSEPDFGAALLTDCKYGYDAVEQTIRLTSLKAPIVPDPNADIGTHTFRYALRLHRGEQDLSDVVQAAERFNNPIRVSGEIDQTGSSQNELEPGLSLASIESPYLTIEAVKLAEAGESIILRIYEHANRRVTSKLNFGLPVQSVVETDLMEGSIQTDFAIADNAINLSFRPFEIKTLKVRFQH